MSGRNPLGWDHRPAGVARSCRTPGPILPMEDHAPRPRALARTILTIAALAGLIAFIIAPALIDAGIIRP